MDCVHYFDGLVKIISLYNHHTDSSPTKTRGCNRQLTNQNAMMMKAFKFMTKIMIVNDDEMDGYDGKMIPQKRFPNFQLTVVTCHVFLF